jgi:membrane protease YdiL (CAAX protease family)
VRKEEGFVVVMSDLSKGSGSSGVHALAASTIRRRWDVIAAIEAVAAAVTVVLDLLVPTLILLAMTAGSLLARRQGLGSLGLVRASGRGLVMKMLAFAVLWSVFQLGVTMPVANHLSGRQQDLSGFDGLQGNLGMLVGLLLLSWTLAAFGEEVAYRGYLLTRCRAAAGGGRAGLIFGVLASSVLCSRFQQHAGVHHDFPRGTRSWAVVSGHAAQSNTISLPAIAFLGFAARMLRGGGRGGGQGPLQPSPCWRRSHWRPPRDSCAVQSLPWTALPWERVGSIAVGGDKRCGGLVALSGLAIGAGPGAGP